jgi:flavodoxin
MKIRVCYHSETGNTKKIAEAMAMELGLTAESVDRAAASIETDLLVLGGAVYAVYDHGLHPALKSFIDGLEREKVGRVALFRTGFSDEAIALMSSRIKAKGIPIEVESFGCKGRFLFFSLGHPGKRDLEAARAFARKIAVTASGTSRKTP